jgi:hypothetical protein
MLSGHHNSSPGMRSSTVSFARLNGSVSSVSKCCTMVLRSTIYKHDDHCDRTENHACRLVGKRTGSCIRVERIGSIAIVSEWDTTNHYQTKELIGDVAVIILVLAVLCPNGLVQDEVYQPTMFAAPTSIAAISFPSASILTCSCEQRAVKSVQQTDENPSVCKTRMAFCISSVE